MKGKNRHHPYPKKYRKLGTETKIVDSRKHAAWHIIVQDLDPVNALCYVILNFMPTEFEPLMDEVKRVGERQLSPQFTIYFLNNGNKRKNRRKIRACAKD